uniref:Uncharacterized protein n=1 Tax=Neospora caninum (strain Liverpool) TaxID=572307 RepID=A0A0F7UHN3_NEOCL|nr:TPA: hypothetical protein BN1204_043090 [Neospora caninum Liverpool]
MSFVRDLMGAAVLDFSRLRGFLSSTASSMYSAGRANSEGHPHALLASSLETRSAHSPRASFAPASSRAKAREEDWEALLRETYLCLPHMKAGEAAEAAYLVGTMYEAGKGGEDKHEVPIELIKALLVHVLQRDPARSLAPVSLHRFLRVSALFPHAADRGLLEDLALTLARRNRHLSVTSLQLIAEDFSSCYLPGFHPLFVSIAEHLASRPRAICGDGGVAAESRSVEGRKVERMARGEGNEAADGKEPARAIRPDSAAKTENAEPGTGERGERFVKEKEDAVTATHACFFFNSYSRTNCHPPRFFQLLSDTIESSLEALHCMQFPAARATAAPVILERFSFSILALGLKGMVNCGFQASEKFVRLAGDLILNYIAAPEESVLHQRGEKLDTKSLLRALTFFCKARPLSLSPASTRFSSLSSPSFSSSSSPSSPSSPSSSSHPSPDATPVSSASPASSSLSSESPSLASPASSPVFRIAACLADELPVHAFCPDDLADLSVAVRCMDSLLLSVFSPRSLALLLQDLGQPQGQQGTSRAGSEGRARLLAEAREPAAPSRSPDPSAAFLSPVGPASAPESSRQASSSSPAPGASLAAASTSPSPPVSPASLSDVPSPLRAWLQLYDRLQSRFLALLKLHLSNLHPFQRISILDQMTSTSAFFPPEMKRPTKHPSLLLALRSASFCAAPLANPEGTTAEASRLARPIAHAPAPPALSPALVSLLRSIYYRLASLNLRLLSLLLASLHSLHFSHEGPSPPSRTQQLCAPHNKDAHWANAFLHILGRESMRKVGTATPEEMAEFLLRYFVDLECFDVCVEPLTFYVEKLAMLHDLRPLPPCVLDALAVTLQTASLTPQAPPALQELSERASAFVEMVAKRACVSR